IAAGAGPDRPVVVGRVPGRVTDPDRLGQCAFDGERSMIRMMWKPLDGNAVIDIGGSGGSEKQCGECEGDLEPAAKPRGHGNLPLAPVAGHATSGRSWQALLLARQEHPASSHLRMARAAGPLIAQR